MKRMIAAAAAGIIIISLCLFTQIKVKSTVEQLTSFIEIIMNESDQNKQLEQATALKQIWEKKREFFYTFTEHDDVMKADESIEMIVPHLQKNNTEHFYEECYKTIHALNHIYSSEKPSLSNIF